VYVAGEYVADFLSSRPVRAHMSTAVVTFAADDTLGRARAFIAGGDAIARHQGFPLVDVDGRVVGVLTRRDLTNPARGDHEPLRALVRRPAVLLHEDANLRDAVDQMARSGVGRLPVVSRDERRLVGIVSRSDVLAAEAKRLADAEAPRRRAAS
ncbi:MAG: CBS domain-containing protein, partial [Polyangia bacterium]